MCPPASCTTITVAAVLVLVQLPLTLFLCPVVATKGQSCTKHCTKSGQRPPGGFVGLVNTVKTCSRQQRERGGGGDSRWSHSFYWGHFQVVTSLLASSTTNPHLSSPHHHNSHCHVQIRTGLVSSDWNIKPWHHHWGQWPNSCWCPYHMWQESGRTSLYGAIQRLYASWDYLLLWLSCKMIMSILQRYTGLLLLVPLV